MFLLLRCHHEQFRIHIKIKDIMYFCLLYANISYEISSSLEAFLAKKMFVIETPEIYFEKCSFRFFTWLTAT